MFIKKYLVFLLILVYLSVLNRKRGDIMKNFKKILTVSMLASALVLSGCATNGDLASQNAVDCSNGTSLGGAALGAVAGGLLGSLVGGGTGQTVATVAGAAAGGYAGSKTRVGCDNQTRYQQPQYQQSQYDSYGYDRYGFDRNGYDRNGYNQNGYNRSGYRR
jgi:outer membrane lipoprotein SlyB